MDVTLAAEGNQLQAHKVVLSACSTYFEVPRSIIVLHNRVTKSSLPLADIVHPESVQASDCDSEGCAIQRPQDAGRLHVLRRGERVAGATAAHHQDGGDAQDQGTGRNVGRGLAEQVRFKVGGRSGRRPLVGVGQYE